MRGNQMHDERRVEPAVAIADLEHKLTCWLVDEPEVLRKLFGAAERAKDPDLYRVAQTLAQMRALQEEFDVDTATNPLPVYSGGAPRPGLPLDHWFCDGQGDD